MHTLVIGSSSGIGKAIYDELEASGLDPIGFSRTKHIFCDVTKPISVINAFEKIRGKEIAAMIYCAGTVSVGSITADEYVHMERVISTNLLGAMYCTKLFARLFNGCIIYIASTAGTRGEPRWASYAASKAGLINYAMSVHEAFKGERRVYCISPGRCATPLRKLIAPMEDQSKIMQPETLGRLIPYLICDTDGNLAGQNIVVRRETK